MHLLVIAAQIVSFYGNNASPVPLPPEIRVHHLISSPSPTTSSATMARSKEQQKKKKKKQAPSPTTRVKDSVTYLRAGTSNEGLEIVFAIYKRGQTSSKTNFYAHPTGKNATYDDVKQWDPAFGPKLPTQKAHMKEVQRVWLNEIGYLYQAKTGASTGAPPDRSATATQTPTRRNATSQLTDSSPAIATPTSSARKRQKLGRTDDQLFWQPNGEALSKPQTNRIGRNIKKALELSDVPPHEVIQAMVTYRFTLGEYATPFMASEWESWLESTGNIMPAMSMDAALEALFTTYVEQQDAGAWKDTETEEEKKAIMGEELLADLNNLSLSHQMWLKDLRDE